MDTYRKEWDCCGSVTETEAWEPEECPFCTPPKQVTPTHPHLEGLIRKWREAASVWHEKGTEYGEASAITLADCADELEAVSDVGLIGRSEKAVRVLSTMLRKAGLNEGASIADELLADLAKARVAAPALEGATLRAALQSCVDYGSSGWDDWILEKANAALAALPGGGVGPIERDESYDRDYIPLPGGWEVQTKGKGSTFRICGPDDESLAIPDSPYLHATLTQMARDIHAALSPTPLPHEADRNE